MGRRALERPPRQPWRPFEHRFTASSALAASPSLVASLPAAGRVFAELEIGLPAAVTVTRASRACQVGLGRAFTRRILRLVRRFGLPRAEIDSWPDEEAIRRSKSTPRRKSRSFRALKSSSARTRRSFRGLANRSEERRVGTETAPA